MIKRIISILLIAASIAVMTLVVMKHRSIRSLIPERTEIARPAPAEAPAEIVPRATDSLRMQTDTLQSPKPGRNEQ